MLDWARTLWNDSRVALDFRASERRNLRVRKAEAAALFSVEQQQSTIAELTEQISAEANKKFDDLIRNNLFRHEGLCARKAEHERRAKLFRRDFKAELQALRDELQDIEEKQQDANSEKKAAHESRKRAQADIDWWYRKSDCILLNRGKKIPKKSLFWQSQSDLDRAKARRESAYRRVRSAEAKLKSLSKDWEDTRSEIDCVKSARDEVRTLRSEGVSPQSIARQINDLENGLSLSSRRISELHEQKDAFILESRKQRGLVSLEDEVLRLRAEHKSFVEEFKAADAVASRRREHRLRWDRRDNEKQASEKTGRAISFRLRWSFDDRSR